MRKVLFELRLTAACQMSGLTLRPNSSAAALPPQTLETRHPEFDGPIDRGTMLFDDWQKLLDFIGYFATFMA
jgi:hypothetical protein